MTYIALYRKYRSQTFEDVVGQDHVTRTLQNAIKSGRISHAYLFCGSRGTGKTTVARLVAKAVNCLNGPTPEPCNECDACKSINDGSAVDVIEMDAASNRGIGDVKAIRDNVKYPPMSLRYKIYIIDEAHQLSADAKDAFLKTLEEPPAHAIFILATTEAHAIPATIRSRCQQFDFRRGSLSDITGRLRYVCEREGVTVDDGALELLAENAAGSWRDGLSLLEQVLAYTGREVTAKDVSTVLGSVDQEMLFEVGDVLAGKDPARAFEVADRMIAEGKDVRELLRSITGHFRDVLHASVGLTVGGEYAARYREQAGKFSRGELIALVETFAAAEKEMRWNDQHRLVLELAMLKACGERAAPAAKASTADQAAPAAPSPREASKASTSAAAVEKTSEPVRVDAVRELSEPAQPAAQKRPKPSAEPSVVEGTVTAAETERDGDVTIEDIRRNWSQILARLNKGKDKAVHALMREGRPVSVEGGCLTVGFAGRHQWHKSRLDDPQNQQTICSAISAVMGKNLKLRTTLLDKEEIEGAPVASGQEPFAPADEGEPLVRDVLTMFGGEVVEEDHNPWEDS